MEVDKIARQNLGARGVRGKVRWVVRREKGRIGKSLGEWDGWDEGWIWEQGSKYLN